MTVSRKLISDKFAKSMPGPVGTAVASAAGLLGASFWLNLAGVITGALGQGKGVAFYTKWGFPPVRAEIE